MVAFSLNEGECNLPRQQGRENSHTIGMDEKRRTQVKNNIVHINKKLAFHSFACDPTLFLTFCIDCKINEGQPAPLLHPCICTIAICTKFSWAMGNISKRCKNVALLSRGAGVSVQPGRLDANRLVGK